MMWSEFQCVPFFLVVSKVILCFRWSVTKVYFILFYGNMQKEINIVFSWGLVILVKQIATAFFTAYLVIIWNSGSYLSHILVGMCRIYDKTFFTFLINLIYNNLTSHPKISRILYLPPLANTKIFFFLIWGSTRVTIGPLSKYVSTTKAFKHGY